MGWVKFVRHLVLAFESAWVDTVSIYLFGTFIGGYSGNFNHMGIATSRGNGLRVGFVFSLYAVYLFGFGVAHMLLRGRHPARIFVTGMLQALLLFLCDLVYNLAIRPDEINPLGGNSHPPPDGTSDESIPWTLLLASAGFAMQNEIGYYTTGTPVVTLITAHSQDIVLAFLDRWIYSDDVRVRNTAKNVENSLILVASYITGCVLAGLWVVMGQRASPWAFTPVAFVIFVHTLAESVGECVSRTPPEERRPERARWAESAREQRRLLAGQSKQPNSSFGA